MNIQFKTTLRGECKWEPADFPEHPDPLVEFAMAEAGEVVSASLAKFVHIAARVGGGPYRHFYGDGERIFEDFGTECDRHTDAIMRWWETPEGKAISERLRKTGI